MEFLLVTHTQILMPIKIEGFFENKLRPSVGLLDVSRDKWSDSTSPKYAQHFVSWFGDLQIDLPSLGRAEDGSCS